MASDNEVKKTETETFEGLMSKTFAAGKLLKEASSGYGWDFARAVIGIFDMFSGLPVMPLFELFIPAQPDESRRLQETLDNAIERFGEELHHINGLLDVLNTRIGELGEEIALKLELITDKLNFQKYATNIDACTKAMIAYLNEKHLNGASEDSFKLQFLDSGQKNEQSLNKLIALVIPTVVGNESIMKLQYEKKKGHLKPLAALGYLLHVYLIRGMTCSQLFKLHKYDHVVSADAHRSRICEIGSCYKKIAEILKKCVDDVGKNLEKEFLDGLMNLDYFKDNPKFEEKWIELQNNFDFVDMRYLVVGLENPQYNGFTNAVIYCAKNVQKIYSQRFSVRGAIGVFIFYILLTEGQQSGSQIDETDYKIFRGSLQRATDQAIRETTQGDPVIEDWVVQEGVGIRECRRYRYFAGLAGIPGDNKVKCLVMVTDFVYGTRHVVCARSNNTLGGPHAFSRMIFFSPQKTCNKTTSCNIELCWTKTPNAKFTAWIAKNEKPEDLRKAFDEIVKYPSSDTFSTNVMQMKCTEHIKGPPLVAGESRNGYMHPVFARYLPFQSGNGMNPARERGSSDASCATM